MPFSLMTDCVCRLELNLAVYVCVAAEVTASEYHLQKGSQRAAAAGMMVAAKCQQTPLWIRFAKTAAPCDDTDSVLNAQWHGKCLLVVSRLHLVAPLIATLPLLCVVTPAVGHLLFRRNHGQSESIIREKQQHIDGRRVGFFVLITSKCLSVFCLHTRSIIIFSYLSLICLLYFPAPRSSWKRRAFWRIPEQMHQAQSWLHLAMLGKL